MRVIVADDEEIIRTGIVELMPWSALGYHVVGEAEDGEEALELIKAQRPEVVITDIKMPFITGIELLKHIKNLYAPLYTILLTGYDEFKFAQAAVNQGAYAYLLKPVEPSELARILTEIREDYEKKQALKSLVKELKTQIAVKKVLYGLGDLNEVRAFLSENGQDVDALWFGVFIIGIDDHAAMARSEKASAVKSLLFEAVKSGDSMRTVITENQGFMDVVVVWQSSAHACKSCMADTIGQVRELIAAKGVSLSAAVGGTYRGVTGIKRSYDEAMQAMSVKFLRGKNTDIYFEKVIGEIDRQQDAQMDMDEITVKISFDTPNAMIESVDKTIDAVKKRGAYSYIYVQLLITNIFIYALGQLRKAEVDIDKTFGNPLNRFETILAMETAEDRIGGLKMLLLDVYDIIEAGRTNACATFIIKAEEYIAESFSDKNICLGDVIRHVAVSQAHFCVAFKKKTGETFIDYLTRIRMEKARELLTLSNRRIYEIAEMVGYENATYFSTLFKKHYKMSPSEFKRAAR